MHMTDLISGCSDIAFALSVIERKVPHVSKYNETCIMEERVYAPDLGNGSKQKDYLFRFHVKFRALVSYRSGVPPCAIVL